MGATEDPKLLNFVNDLFRAGGKVPGGTAGAVRYYKITGEVIGNTHIEKAEIYLRGLNNYISDPKNIQTDIQIAKVIAADLFMALNPAMK
jgi:hypothetical protein